MKTSYDFSEGVRDLYLKRIIVSVNIENALDVTKSLSCDAFVDTDIALMMLPKTWKAGLGRLESTGIIEFGTSTLGKTRGEICGPVRIQIEGFRPINTEVVFVEVKADGDEFEPLLGHLIVAQSQARIDVLGHRLMPIKYRI